MSQNRLKNEQVFHDNRFKDGGEIIREKAIKFRSANKAARERYVEIISKYCKGKKLLEYGCGTGSGSEQWLKFGAVLTGIDISPEGIKKAKERIANTEYDADYFVMNAESTEFQEDSFDIAVGSAILHHLDLLNSYKELCRILKKDGHAVFYEPLGHNPFINFYRTMTPQMRTEDEHPLKIEDIKLLEQYFHNVEIDCYSLFTLFAIPFRNTLLFDKILGFLRSIDKAVFHIPFMNRFAWIIIIHASNPKNCS